MPPRCVVRNLIHQIKLIINIRPCSGQKKTKQPTNRLREVFKPRKFVANHTHKNKILEISSTTKLEPEEVGNKQTKSKLEPEDSDPLIIDTEFEEEEVDSFTTDLIMEPEEADPVPAQSDLEPEDIESEPTESKIVSVGSEVKQGNIDSDSIKSELEPEDNEPQETESNGISEESDLDINKQKDKTGLSENDLEKLFTK